MAEQAPEQTIPQEIHEAQKRNVILWTVFLIVVIALIVLPTGTPEDIITTAPIIATIGFKNFLLVSAILILILIILLNQKETKDIVKDTFNRITGIFQ